MFNIKKAVSKKEVIQHIKTLKYKGWNYLGVTGAGHHKMEWPHAPEGKGILRFSATPSDASWLKNSQRDAQVIESNYPAPVENAENTERAPSAWESRFKIDQEKADAESRETQKLNEVKQKTPLTVQEKMRLLRQQMYKEKGL